MNVRKLIGAALALATTFAVVPAGATSPAAPATTWTAVADRYEVIRLALVADNLDGVAAAAKSIQSAAATLAKKPTAAAAGVPAAKLAAVQALLPEIDKASAALAAAPNIEAARDAFYQLSKPLVQWREAAGTGPAVAFCSMAKRSWLQPKGDIGNPYYGASMAKCGELVGG